MFFHTKASLTRVEFRKRLLLPEHREVTIGAALLNQRILAGLGNYLRAEVLFACRMDPWRKIGELKEKELDCLAKTAPKLARRSYVSSATVTAKDRERMRSDTALVYQQGREYGTRHWVFRRTNLPCLRCNETVKQLRQETYNFSEDADDQRTRIIYFCPKCQTASFPDHAFSLYVELTAIRAAIASTPGASNGFPPRKPRSNSCMVVEFG